MRTADRRIVAGLLPGCLVVLPGVGGCFGSDRPPPDNPPVHVSLSLTILSSGPSGAKAPVPDVSVAVDQADGTRLEHATDRNGVVTFDVDISPGNYDFTIAAPGYVAVSELGVPNGGSATLTLERFGEDPTWTEIGGIVRGKSDPDHGLLVSPTVPGTVFDGPGPNYALRVGAAGPFSLVAAELAPGPSSATQAGDTLVFTSWAEFAGLSASAVGKADLDLPGVAGAPGDVLGQSLRPIVTSGTFVVPEGMSGSAGHLLVSTRESGGAAFLGAATSVEARPDGTLAYTAEYVTPAGAATPYTTYWLTLGGASSFSVVMGPPVGAQTFIQPPTLPSPQPLYGPLPIESGDPSRAASIDVVRDGNTVAWRVFRGAPQPTPVHWRLPKLPSAVDPRLVLGTGRISAVPVVCVAATDGTCRQFAEGAAADLVSP
ncbi:MAG: carboxypeptidase regulatory-like domain-containing protein [Myxococcales bacterium]|nr:carboxypeptidase regulatory-like domain-containing protein [Myxococcales bacterium]